GPGAVTLHVGVPDVHVRREALERRVDGPVGEVHEPLPDRRGHRTTGHVAPVGRLDRQRIVVLVVVADPDGRGDLPGGADGPGVAVLARLAVLEFPGTGLGDGGPA